MRLGRTIQHLTRAEGARITRAELAKRFGVHRNTVTRIIASPGFPQAHEGKWLLSEVMEWELSQSPGNVGGAGVVVDGGKLRVAPAEHPAQVQQMKPQRKARGRRVSAVVEGEAA